MNENAFGAWQPDQPQTSDVAATFASYPPAIRSELLALRRLILDTAAETEGVGEIEETLKWGQPSYLNPETRSGSTIRIAPTNHGSEHDFGMYFICHTNLVDTFERLFPDAFTYESNRALLFSVGESIPEDKLRECIAMALTYHQSR